MIGILQGKFLILELYTIKLFRPNYSLSSVIDKYIQFYYILFDKTDQLVYLLLRQEITLQNEEIILPLLVVLLFCISEESIVGETRCDIHLGTISQQLQSYLVTYFDTTTSD